MIIGADNFNNFGGKSVIAVPKVRNPRTELIFGRALTPKGRVKMTKAKEEKHQIVPRYLEDWEFIWGPAPELVEGLGVGDVLRFENMHTYPNTLGRDGFMEAWRDAGIDLQQCPPGTVYRYLTRREGWSEERARHSCSDEAAAVVLYRLDEKYFHRAKLDSEKRAFDRYDVCKLLEESESYSWGDSTAAEALNFLAPYMDRFPEDVAEPVFLVTAYWAAKELLAQEPRATVREFDVFCGLFAQARNGKKGIGSVISSNLSHFNDNKDNRKFARFIFHKLSEAQADLSRMSRQ